ASAAAHGSARRASGPSVTPTTTAPCGAPMARPSSADRPEVLPQEPVRPAAREGGATPCEQRHGRQRGEGEDEPVDVDSGLPAHGALAQHEGADGSAREPRAPAPALRTAADA